MPMFKCMYDLGNIQTRDDDDPDIYHPHDSNYEAVAIQGTADEICAPNDTFIDSIAGMMVTRVTDDGSHDGKPARVFHLRTHDWSKVTDKMTRISSGRLVVLPDTVIEWVRDFGSSSTERDDDGWNQMDEFISHFKRRDALKRKLAWFQVDMAFEEGGTPEETAAIIAATHGVSVEIVERHGPGGGWPVVKVSGLRGNVIKALTSDEYGWSMSENDIEQYVN